MQRRGMYQNGSFHITFESAEDAPGYAVWKLHPGGLYLEVVCRIDFGIRGAFQRAKDECDRWARTEERMS